MKLPRLLNPAFAVFFVSISRLFAQETYHVTQLPAVYNSVYDGAGVTFSSYYGSGTAYGLNDAGGVVTAAGVFYSEGTAAFLPEVYASSNNHSNTSPWDVNNSGAIVGHGGDSYYYGQLNSGSYQHGFIYDSTSSTMTDAGLLPGGLESRLFTINNGGTAAGWAQILEGSVIRVQAATFSGGTLTNVHDSVKLSATDAQSAIFGISDAGNLAGYSISANGAYQAFRSDGTTSVSLGDFGGTNSVALGLNDSATVGWAENTDGLRQAFVSDGTTMTNLDAGFTGTLATSSQSAAAAINEGGIIVGKTWKYGDGSYYYDQTQGFVSDGTQSWALTDLVNSSGTGSWKVVSASDINASGQIAATANLSANSYSYGGTRNAVVLTPETAWTSGGNGSWDTAANWQNSQIPGENGAAFLNLADGVTVTGPAAAHTLYALTVGSTGTSATLQLQSGANLTVLGDTELRAGGIIDATNATLETSYLHGSGTVNGTVNAGMIHVGNGHSLTLQGVVNASITEIGASGLLKTSGILHSVISGHRNGYTSGEVSGAVQLTGDAALGGADLSHTIKLGTLDVAGHSATLLTGSLDSHHIRQVVLGDGGQVTANTGVIVNDYLSGEGSISGNVAINGAVVQPGLGKSMVINGDLTGSGLLVGPNISVTGTTTATSYGWMPSANIGTEDAVVFGSRRLEIRGNLEMSGGTITAVNGLGLSPNRYEPGEITGSGVIAGSLTGGGIVTATGALTLGDVDSEIGVNLNTYYNRYDYYSNSFGVLGTLNTGANTVTLLDFDLAEIGRVNLDGGTIIAANGLSAYRIEGHGDISAAVSGSSVFGGPHITATGSLSLGDAASTSGVIAAGLSVGANTVTLRDADFAEIGRITSSGGTINATNGLKLYEGTGIVASGAGLASTIQGDLMMTNSTLEATTGSSLTINGALSGYGILLGNVSANSITATAGDVVISNTLDVGARTMTVVAQSRALLGGTTELAGGSIGATNGLGLGSGQIITGYGTVNTGSGQALQLSNGIIEATAGQALTINGDLEGYGVTIGTVNVSGSNTMSSAPSGAVVLSRSLDIGNRAAAIYSNAVPIIGADMKLAGGSLSSSNGIIINQSEISGNGSISSDVTLKSGVLNASGSGLAISGSLSGHGVVVGDVTAGSNSLSSPTGRVSISSLDIGDRIGNVYSNDRASLESLVSQGGTLKSGIASEVLSVSLSNYRGHGTIDGDVHLNNGLFIVDVGSSLDITGSFTGYGIVVGSHNKVIGAPTGTVEFDVPWQIRRSDITVYSLEAPKIEELKLEADARIFSAQGWELANLAGSGTIGGNVAIQTILSPGFSPGTIHFENDLTLAMASTTVLEFAGTGAGQYDFLDIMEAFTMGGALQVNFLDGFDPDTGLLPEWFSAGSFSGDFSNVAWSGLGDGKNVTFNSSTGRLGISEIVTIPEPSGLFLALPTSAFLILRRRRSQVANTPST